MTTHKGRDAVASSPLWLVILEEPFNYFIVHLCILSTFLENFWADILLAVTKRCRCSAAVIHLSIIAVIIECLRDKWLRPGGRAQKLESVGRQMAHETIPKHPLTNNGDTLATARKNDLGVFRLGLFGVSVFTIIDSSLFQSVSKMAIIFATFCEFIQYIFLLQPSIETACYSRSSSNIGGSAYI